MNLDDLIKRARASTETHAPTTAVAMDTEEFEALLREDPPELIETEAPLAEPAVSDEVVDRFLEVAALRTGFYIDELTPLVAGAPERASAIVDRLALHCDIATGESGASWILRDEERKQALLRLTSRNELRSMVDHVRQAVREPSTIEQALWRAINNELGPLAVLPPSQLRTLHFVSQWLEGVPGHSCPPPSAIASLLDRESLLEPFRHLTGKWEEGRFVSHFAGREHELQRIYDYVGLIPPASLQSRLKRLSEWVVHHAWGHISGQWGHRPLLIYGLGGSGKSTLLAKFLLDHLTDMPVAQRFPFAYLDLDLSALNAKEPLTLIAEAARQLATQYPEAAEQWNALKVDCQAASRRGVAETERQEALNRLASLLGRSSRFLLVLDTFEELQYHDRDSVKDVFRFLNALRVQVPEARTIIMGRAPLTDVQSEFESLEAQFVEGDTFATGAQTDFGVIEVPLGDLSPEASREFLQSQGIANPELIEELVEVVGGNPLSLRLIAKVLQAGALDLQSLREETTWRPSLGNWLFGKRVPPRTVLQGVLLNRILGHIHDLEVRRLAHPGLLLRRITPDIIRNVLAEPCGLEGADPLRLFEELRREASLVLEDVASTDGPAVRHRTEVRRVMLRLMKADEEKREQAERIHRNAIQYYSGRSDAVAREETLYHQLMLNEPPRPDGPISDIPTEEAVEAGYAMVPEVDPRPAWRALARSIDELPLASRPYLDARLHLDLVPESEWGSADPQDWELSVLGRASRRSRERSQIKSAIATLREHGFRTSHPSIRGDSDLALALAALQTRTESTYEDLVVDREWEYFSGSTSSPKLVLQWLLVARTAAVLGDWDTWNGAFGLASEAIVDGAASGFHGWGEKARFQALRLATDCLMAAEAEEDAHFAVLTLLSYTAPDSISKFPVLVRTSLAALANMPTHRQDWPQGTRHDYAGLFRFVWGSVALNIGFLTVERMRINLSQIGLSTDYVNDVMRQMGILAFSPPHKVQAPNLVAILFGDFRETKLPDRFRDERLARAVLTALAPPLPERTPDEDPHEEAKRMGMLVPCEGPVQELLGRREKRKKR